MHKFLKNLIERKQKEINDTRDKIKNSEDIAEVRALGETLEALRSELEDAKSQLAKLDEDKDEGDEGGTGGTGDEGGEGRSGFDPNRALGSTRMNGDFEDDNPLSSMEYRTAFMRYVQRGERAEILTRDDTHYAGNVAEDLGVLIPQTVIQEIIKGVEKVYGQLYSRVKKTNVKGGVKYPIGSFSATFNRITETGAGAAPSARQHGGAITGHIQFGYNIGEIRLAKTLLESVLEVPVFEAELSKVIVEAYIQAMDKEIMTGVATNNQCEGILTEAAKIGQTGARLTSDNIIEFSEEDMADWTTWQKNLFAKIPLSMRGLNPEFVMTANTYEANIKTLKDDNNRPLYTETFNPVDGAEIARFKGKNVVFVEEDILGNFNDISVETESTDSPYFGMYWVPEKAYAINTNLEFFVKRYFDEEKNEWVDKALVINDGKILDPKYLYLLKKVASTPSV